MTPPLRGGMRRDIPAEYQGGSPGLEIGVGASFHILAFACQIYYLMLSEKQHATHYRREEGLQSLARACQQGEEGTPRRGPEHAGGPPTTAREPRPSTSLSGVSLP